MDDIRAIETDMDGTPICQACGRRVLRKGSKECVHCRLPWNETPTAETLAAARAGAVQRPTGNGGIVLV